MPDELTYEALIARLLGGCIDHEHEQAGRCVYCKPCGRRLYQGSIMPASERAELKQALAKMKADCDG
jgi:hypothetical protein